MKTYENRLDRSSVSAPQGSPNVPETILVPIDFSPASKAALPHAIRLVAQCSGSIILLHVIETLPLQAALGYVPDEVRKACFKLVRQAEAVLARLARRTINSHVRSKVVVRIGVPHKAIVDVAREMAADLILVGTEGHGGLKRALLGSTTELIVRHATCSVLVLRVPTPARGRHNRVSISQDLASSTVLTMAPNLLQAG